MHISFAKEMFEYAFDGGEARTTGDEYDGFFRFFPQKECAERAFKAQDIPLLHASEHMLGKRSSAIVPYM